ncbi:hypothetical protein JVT61DRAFT_3696 [Boletus reticuloceps]|uniref:Plasma membrane fusion protein PRM1 n=1 Tax=Boletus reticuloceps TaxID=495285 RepID=A0A8I3A9B6_9AGAM|nr:hypothetical protein JVT61DRAFT_3696 [Boletus reticuloceps]
MTCKVTAQLAIMQPPQIPRQAKPSLRLISSITLSNQLLRPYPSIHIRLRCPDLYCYREVLPEVPRWRLSRALPRALLDPSIPSNRPQPACCASSQPLLVGHVDQLDDTSPQGDACLFGQGMLSRVVKGNVLVANLTEKVCRVGLPWRFLGHVEGDLDECIRAVSNSSAQVSSSVSKHGRRRTREALEASSGYSFPRRKHKHRSPMQRMISSRPVMLPNMLQPQLPVCHGILLSPPIDSSQTRSHRHLPFNIQLVVVVGLGLLISAVQEIDSFLQSTLNNIASGIKSDITSVNSAIQSAMNSINKVNPFGNIQAPQFNVSSLDSLSNIAIPTNFENALIQPNNSLPTVSSIKNTIQDLMYSQSAAYASTISTKIETVQSSINNGLFGWVNDTTTTLNSTLNNFYTDIQNLVSTVFNRTILEMPAQDFIKCLIGSKVDAIEEALTFLNQNLNVDLPQVNKTILVLSSADVNEITRPVATAAIGGTSSNSQGLVGRLVATYVNSLKKERLMFSIFMGLWGVVVSMGLVIVFWHWCQELGDIEKASSILEPPLRSFTPLPEARSPFSIDLFRRPNQASLPSHPLKSLEPTFEKSWDSFFHEGASLQHPTA